MRAVLFLIIFSSFNSFANCEQRLKDSMLNTYKSERDGTLDKSNLRTLGYAGSVAGIVGVLSSMVLINVPFGYLILIGSAAIVGASSDGYRALKDRRKVRLIKLIEQARLYKETGVINGLFKRVYNRVTRQNKTQLSENEIANNLASSILAANKNETLYSTTDVLRLRDIASRPKFYSM